MEHEVEDKSNNIPLFSPKKKEVLLKKKNWSNNLEGDRIKNKNKNPGKWWPHTQ